MHNYKCLAEIHMYTYMIIHTHENGHLNHITEFFSKSDSRSCLILEFSNSQFFASIFFRNLQIISLQT